MSQLPPHLRGLGSDHQRRRAALAKPAGQPCPFCGRPMWPRQALDADHKIPRAEGGVKGPLRWAHSRCNRKAGGRLGAERAKSSKVRSRRW